jgi:SAM-dependent methyltransferase
LTSPDNYTGVDNLDVLDVAVNYRRFLAALILGSGGDPKSGRAVLDFGAGDGTYARCARELGYDVMCVELDPLLRRRLLDDGFHTVRDLSGVADHGIDFVYSFNVLEHIEDDLGVLEELHRVTSCDGTLLLYVPAFSVLYSSMDAKVGHVRRYHKAGLASVVEQAGFKVDRCTHADSIGFFASLLYRAFGSREGHLDRRSVQLYDRWVFPISRALDRVVSYWFGKNLILTARRQGMIP